MSEDHRHRAMQWPVAAARGKIDRMTRRRLLLVVATVALAIASAAIVLWPDRLTAEEVRCVGTWGRMLVGQHTSYQTIVFDAHRRAKFTWDGFAGEESVEGRWWV